jgi:hypothetical protein
MLSVSHAVAIKKIFVHPYLQLFKRVPPFHTKRKMAFESLTTQPI